MRRILLLSLALTFKLVRTQEHRFPKLHGPQSLHLPQHRHTTIITTPCLSSPYRTQQVIIAHRHLEARTAQLNLEVRELLMKRHEALKSLKESAQQGNCKCESFNALTTPSQTQPTVYPEPESALRNSSWRLESTEAISNLVEIPSKDRHASSFFASTMFAFAVIFMIVPVAFVIGFVIFCRRKRRPRYTHA
ncbi:hypothetical protein CCR75_008154 [Bremia lactucae]|uniref:Uncharacterized protein n=1 Tax=Bremia lactucae TaxID=4779 RepID=A0A976FEL1_BRELC|nr:hypothetical protein CCR75_008154 [Bremia lactucae]